MKPDEVDSEIASDLSSEIDEDKNDSDNQKISQSMMIGKRFSGGIPMQRSISKSQSGDLDSPHSRSVDASNYKKSSKLNYLGQSNFKGNFVTIDESVQEDDEAKSRNMMEEEDDMSIDRMTEQLDQLSLHKH